MKNPMINSLIKTQCGRETYAKLIQNQVFIPRLRLYWFIFWAVLKDWNIPNPDKD